MGNNVNLLSKILNLSSLEEKKILDLDLNAQELIFSEADYLRDRLKLNEPLISRITSLRQLISDIAFEKLKKKSKIREPKDIINYLKTILRTLSKECFVVLYLNKGNDIVDHAEISGMFDRVKPDFRFIVKRALVSESASIICAHNHPGGNPFPSDQDKGFTFFLKKNIGTFGY